jgi:hypothetical protein
MKNRIQSNDHVKIKEHREEHVGRRYIICPLSLLLFGEFQPMN